MLASLVNLAQMTQSTGGDAAGGVALGFICMIVLFGLAVFVFWIWALIDAIRNPRLTDNERLIWILVIVLAQGLGALIYVLAGRKS